MPAGRVHAEQSAEADAQQPTLLRHRSCWARLTASVFSMEKITIADYQFSVHQLAAVLISNLSGNLKTFFSPRLKAGARKFGKLASLKLLVVSESRCLVS